jgi:hypothetical protein
MRQFRFSKSRGKKSRIFAAAIAVTVQLGVCGLSFADEEALPTPPQAPPNASTRNLPRVNAPTTSGAMTMRSGGLLNESFDYHHPQPMRSAIELGAIPQAPGWYNYGFPMRSYRWGYFGAERHYPWVMWHQGYYGDKVRTAYRYSY